MPEKEHDTKEFPDEDPAAEAKDTGTDRRSDKGTREDRGEPPAKQKAPRATKKAGPSARPTPPSGPLDGIRTMSNRLFSSKIGIIIAGAFIGIVAALLQSKGNPGNMGFCIACFQRDIVGALRLHSAGPVQYIRPEIIGIVLGALIASLFFKEYRARSGSAPIIRFVLGFFAMMGALVFLGCPWRAYLRLAGGDWNAIVGLVGLGFGVFVGTLFIRNGFNLGRSRKTYRHVGLVIPILMIGLLLALLVDPAWTGGGKIFASTPGGGGPGAMAAPIAMSLAIALAVGFLAQRTRFCTIGGMRDAILIRDFHLLFGALALLIAAFVTNMVLGQYEAGWEDQPLAHTDGLWNFLGMTLSGLAFALAGGCPGRQLVLSGEGDADAGIFIFGMMAAAAFAHNFRIAATGAGVSEWSGNAVLLGLLVCGIIGFTMRDRA